MFKSIVLALAVNLGLVGLAHSADKYVVWYALSSSGETKELNISKVFAVPEELNEEDISNMYKKYLTNKGKEANFPNRNVKIFSSQAEAVKFKDSYTKQYELIDSIKVVEDTIKEEGRGSQGELKKVTWPLNTQEAQDYQKEQAAKYKMELKKTVSMGEFCGKNSVFVFIPPGEYTMGSPASEEGRNSDEVQRKVIVKEPFYMQESECETPLPKLVSEVPTMLQNMNKYAPDGFIFRLPSEAEWEYAARAGRTTAYLYGNESMGVSFSDPNKRYVAPLPLAKNFKPNSWGLYDVLGRKAELVRGMYYEPKPSDIAVDSKEYNKAGGNLLIRGGASWLGEKNNRLASRLAYPFDEFFPLDNTSGNRYSYFRRTDSNNLFEKYPAYFLSYSQETPNYHMVGVRLLMEILN
jgi:formylglycine-generating enzyme required for sulfatase activity